MFSSWVPLFVASIVICCIFSIAAVIFFILWILSLLRGGLQRSCPECAAMVPSSARFCTHCGKAIPAGTTQRRGSKTLLVLLITCVLITGASVAGIVVSAVSGDIGDSGYEAYSMNFDDNSTNSGWNITFDQVRGCWRKKNISIQNGTPKQLHVQSHEKSGGSMILDVEQGNIKKEINLSSTDKDSTMDLSGFKNGKVSITVEIKDATDGGINMWWG